MIRLFHSYFPVRTIALFVSEALLIAAALLAAFWLSMREETWLALFYDQGMYRLAVATVVCLVCMYFYDMYDPLVLCDARHTSTRLVEALGMACMVLAAVYYAYPAARLRAQVFLVGIPVSGAALTLWRGLFSMLTRLPRFQEPVLLLGQGPFAEALAVNIQARPQLGLRLTGFLGAGPEACVAGLRWLGSPNCVLPVIQREGVRRVIVAMSEARGQLPVSDLLRAKSQGVVVQDGADLYEAATGRVPLEALRLSWLLFSPGFRISRAVLAYKRAASLLFSAAGLILTLPLTLLIAAAIKLDSKGPAIFRQQRVGKDGRLFTLFKFRSMAHGADSHQPARLNDPRFTRVGRWLRTARLDEIPQLYNIFRGDMYVVGPRPFVSSTEDELMQKIPFYSQRFTIKPGATGWAQINRGYCATLEDNAEKLSYDLYYIKNISIGLDLLIVAQTIKILLLGRGAR